MQKMELLSQTGNEMFRNSYKAELMGAKVVYYLNIGDYQAYVDASLKILNIVQHYGEKTIPIPAIPTLLIPY